jgi:hypothetical protein
VMPYNSSFRFEPELSSWAGVEPELSVCAADESGRFNLKGMPACFLMNLYISTIVLSPSKVICKVKPKQSNKQIELVYTMQHKKQISQVSQLTKAP